MIIIPTMTPTKFILFIWTLFSLTSCQALPGLTPTELEIEPGTNSISTTTTDQPTGPFAIYPTRAYIRQHDLTGSELDCGRLADQPLLSAADILAYQWDTHQIEITHEAYQRLSRLEVPISGQPFVACVGRHPVYSGALWTALSSASFNGVVILFPLLHTDRVQIELGYPGVDFFEGSDPRPHPQIHQSLSQAKKLK